MWAVQVKGQDFDDRFFEVPDTDNFQDYLREGFYPQFIDVFRCAPLDVWMILRLVDTFAQTRCVCSRVLVALRGGGARVVSKQCDALGCGQKRGARVVSKQCDALGCGQKHLITDATALSRVNQHCVGGCATVHPVCRWLGVHPVCVCVLTRCSCSCAAHSVSRATSSSMATRCWHTALKMCCWTGHMAVNRYAHYIRDEHFYFTLACMPTNAVQLCCRLSLVHLAKGKAYFLLLDAHKCVCVWVGGRGHLPFWKEQ